ncbi:MAG: ATP-binding protein [Tissierella sp.]|uniref:ATP-binding protein n=1 Tax=Tissierella sp. TaxID=41274 RepID=UPI003F9D91BE
MHKIRRMFPGGNTSEGFFPLQTNIIGEDRNFLYILKGMPGGGKSSLMKEIAKRALKKDYTVEYHHCPSDPTSIDAVVIVELKIVIVDGTPPHSMDPTYPGITEKIVDLSKYIDEEKIKIHKEKIVRAKKNNSRSYKRAFNYFKAAKYIYKEIEMNNRRFIDYEELRVYEEDIIQEIFLKKEVEVSNSLFKIRNLFSTAYTPEGFFDYTDSLLENIENRYFLNGEIGVGKSEFLERIVEICKWKDYDIEIYYDSFMPEKIESVFIWDIDTIISSNTKTKGFKHETIDFNRFFNPVSINEADYEIFGELKDKGIEGLKGAKKNHFILEESYQPTINFKGIDKEREKIWEEILEFEQL